ncbi:MAG: cytochrome c3 family protein [Limisphaerales bacterium]
MSDVFPKWTNRLPMKIAVGALLVGGAVTAGSWYYLTPKYANVGYQPIQPVHFQHSIHAGQLGIDCRYCHNGVEKSWYSNIPSASTCMNCHNQVLKDDPKLALVRESALTGIPIPWIQIHKVPDYVYFNHSVHVNRGVSCVKCHARIDKMDEVYQAQPLSMTFCLDCHRNPAAHLRPPDKITDLGWSWDKNPKTAAELQKRNGEKFVHDWKVQSLQNCSACHR